MGMIVDGFAHVLPTSFAEALMRAHPTDELRKLAKHTYFGDMENRIRILDKLGIDKQVLTLARPSTWIGIPAEAIPGLTRLANDSVAEAARRFPDRLIAVGTLLTPTEEHLPELDRCMNELCMAGIQIVTNVDGIFVDDPRFEPFFEKANSTRIPIWLHPQLVEGWQGWEGDDWIPLALEAARLAPSAVNRQPWRFHPEPGSITVSVDTLKDSFHIAKRLDCGIAMLHLEVAVRHRGKDGRWEFLDAPRVARFRVKSAAGRG